MNNYEGGAPAWPAKQDKHDFMNIFILNQNKLQRDSNDGWYVLMLLCRWEVFFGTAGFLVQAHCMTLSMSSTAAQCQKVTCE